MHPPIRSWTNQQGKVEPAQCTCFGLKNLKMPSIYRDFIKRFHLDALIWRKTLN